MSFTKAPENRNNFLLTNLRKGQGNHRTTVATESVMDRKRAKVAPRTVVSVREVIRLVRCPGKNRLRVGTNHKTNYPNRRDNNPTRERFAEMASAALKRAAKAARRTVALWDT